MLSPPFQRYSLSLSTSIIVFSINEAMIFKVDMLKRSHAHNMFLRTYRAYYFRRAPSHRFRGPLHRRSKKTTSLAIRNQHVRLSYRSISKPTNRHAMLARATCAPPIPTTVSDPKGPSSQPPHHMKKPTAKRHHAQLLSGFLKSVIIALGMFSCIGSIWTRGEMRLGTRVIRIARKRPRVLKVIRAVRRRRHCFRIIRGPLAYTAFAVFIVWDIQNLVHDEPIEGKDKKTIREDPAAALSDAREELARMMKEDSSRCQ